MPLQPNVYADLLAEKIDRHHVNCWHINTGLTGGPYGTGNRMPLKHTRAIVRAILDGRLAQIATRPDEVFEVNVPVECPDVPAELLDPRSTWSNPDEYDRKALKLAERFQTNYQQYTP